jgi:hypothetical protein
VIYHAPTLRDRPRRRDLAAAVTPGNASPDPTWYLPCSSAMRRFSAA